MLCVSNLLFEECGLANGVATVSIDVYSDGKTCNALNRMLI